MISFLLASSPLINSYIISSDPIPVMTERNKDYTPIISEFNFIVSASFTGSLAAGQSIRVYLDNVIFFQGKIAEKKYDYQMRVYNVIARSDFYVLKDYRVSYENLHSDLVTGTTFQYTPSDNFGLPNVQVLFAITTMMHNAGFLNFTIPSTVTDRVIKSINFGGDVHEMTINDLKMDENMLYAINQASAINTAGILADYLNINSQISFWDFIIEFCSHFGLSLWLTAPGSVWLVPAFTPAPITDNDVIYFKETRSTLGEEGGYVHNLAFNETRSTYNTPSEDPLTDHTVINGEGKNDIPCYSNWKYMFRKPNFPVGDVLDTYPDYCYEADLFLQNKINARINDFTETEIHSSMQNNTNAIHCRINPVTEQSEIIWVQ